MRALDPLHDEYIFTVSDRATGKGAVFDLVDRLGEATRKRLGSPDAGDPSASQGVLHHYRQPEGLGAALPVAAGHEPDGRGGGSPPGRGGGEGRSRVRPRLPPACAAAFWHEWKPVGVESPGLKEVEAAEARASRLPEKERLTLRIFRALVARRLSDAARLSAEAVAAYPLDKDILLQAGDVLFHWEVSMGTAVQYFERALQLDPGSPFAIDHLLDTVWWTGQSARFLPFIEQRAAAVAGYDEASWRTGQRPRRSGTRSTPSRWGSWPQARNGKGWTSSTGSHASRAHRAREETCGIPISVTKERWTRPRPKCARPSPGSDLPGTTPC